MKKNKNGGIPSGATNEESKIGERAGYCPKHKLSWDVQSVGCPDCFDIINKERIEQLEVIESCIETTIKNNRYKKDITPDMFFETLNEIINVVNALKPTHPNDG